MQLDFVFGINTQTGVSTVLNGGTVDTTASRLRLQTSTASNGSAIFTSRKIAKYRPGSGMMARFTGVFTSGASSSTQIIGVGNSTDGYFFGYNGSTFGVLHRNNGVDTWIAQTSWNADNLDGTGTSGVTIDPTKGNVFQIKCPYLGYGVITFWVLHPTTGRWINVHNIQYPNTSTATQVTNANFFFYAQAINAGNTSNLTMYSASVGIFLTGQRIFNSQPRWAMNNSKATITTETNLITIRNCTTYNGVANRQTIKLQGVSFGSSSATSVSTLKFVLNATLGGTPAYTTINGTTANAGVTITSGNSIASYDTAGTTVTGGTYLFNTTVAGASGQYCDLTTQDIYIAPGETLTISGLASASSTLGVSVNWCED